MQLFFNKRFCKSLILKKKQKLLRESFYLLKKTIEGEKLLQKYLLRSKQVRDLQFLKEIFYHFKS